MSIPISETFISPQGEGITVGLMTLFIRVAGCDYATNGHPCKYCDTSYAWKSSNSKMFEVDDIQKQVELTMRTMNLKQVSLTGGEPLSYSPEINSLIHYLGKRFSLSVETNGGHPIWREDCMWSMDLKCPSSGNTKHNIYSNLKLLTNRDQVKFVVETRDDYNFARDLVKSRVVFANVIFQPSWKLLKHSTLISWIKEDKDLMRIVRVGDQLQKRWYPRLKKGV